MPSALQMNLENGKRNNSSANTDQKIPAPVNRKEKRILGIIERNCCKEYNCKRKYRPVNQVNDYGTKYTYNERW